MLAIEIMRVVLVLLIAGVAGGFVYAYFVKPQEEFKSSMGIGKAPDETRSSTKSSGQQSEIEQIKRLSGYAKERTVKANLAIRLYKAGFYAMRDKRRFLLAYAITFVFCTVAAPLTLYILTERWEFAFAGLMLGAGIGFSAPVAWLDRKIRAREEDILYYLPLVIEQVFIGVSSSLDIGPCIAQIVSTADERDSHNPVTEMMVHVERLIRSGLSLQDALLEVGETSGLNEVRHAFMFLSQCSKHGGEISRQLQELANAVTTFRQVQVDARISALAVKATGPLATIFAGFFGMLFAGLFVRVAVAF